MNRPRPVIDPLPPVADAALPWDEHQADPVAALASVRAAHGDTFVVDSGADRYLFLFDAAGVRSFYDLPEDVASKGVADWRMLRRKLPDEVFAGRRTLPHQLFGRHDVGTYLACLDRALDAALAELGPDGELDVFAFSRRLAHRMGLAAWGGPGATTGERFEALTVALDRLDASDAFVRPDLMAAVAAADKAEERAALAACVDLLADAPSPVDDPDDLFSRMAARWADEPTAERRVGLAHDVVLVHLASMSNLFAALGWSIVDVVARPDVVDEVRAGDRRTIEACALESIRLAQRSIMLRYVLAPCSVVTEDGPLAVAQGVTIATLLPLTNASVGPDLDAWDPGRWNGRRLRDPGPAERVTAFGQGSHTCPAQPFSLAAITRTLTRVVGAYDVAPPDRPPAPLRQQIGGVARAAAPVLVRYAAR